MILLNTCVGSNRNTDTHMTISVSQSETQHPNKFQHLIQFLHMSYFFYIYMHARNDEQSKGQLLMSGQAMNNINK